MLNNTYAVILMIAFIMLIGCQETATEDNNSSGIETEKVDANDSELLKLKSDPGESKGYVVDTKKSTIQWLGTKTIGTGKHVGTVNLLAGKMVVKDGIITEGEFRIDMKSLHTTDFEKGSEKYEQLVGHLKSDDFFNVEKYPVATFRISSFEPLKKANADYNYSVKGKLTMKDVTETIFFPALVQVSNGKISVDASPMIDRTKWNVKYGSDKFFDLAKDKVISDNMQIKLSIVTL